MNGIRYDNDEGWYVNDKIHKMPFATIAKYVTYKARRAGDECLLIRRMEHISDVLAVWIAEHVPQGAGTCGVS